MSRLFGARRALHYAPAVVEEVGGGTPDTFNPSDKYQIGLSNGDLTIVNSAGDGNFGLVRSTASKSTGKFYFEFTQSGTGENIGIGFANASKNIINSLMTGGGTHSLGSNSSSGAVELNGGPLGTYTLTPQGNGDTTCVAVDVAAKLGWWRLNNGNWNNDVIGNQNPVGNVGGFDISPVAGDLFIIGESNASPGTGTLNTGPTYTYTKPTGYSDWTA